MLKKILAVLVVLIAIFAAVAAMQPSEFNVSRETTIAATPADIFPYVNTSRAWESWSPWANIDPNAKFTYEGTEAGVGAITHWTGNMEVGTGTSTITESIANERVKYQLDFVKPMEGTSISEFILVPADGGTKVTWTMSGHNNFVAKAMSLIMNCEKMIGEQFDKGLANLKVLAESAPAAATEADAEVTSADDEEEAEVAPAAEIKGEAATE